MGGSFSFSPPRTGTGRRGFVQPAPSGRSCPRPSDRASPWGRGLRRSGREKGGHGRIVRVPPNEKWVHDANYATSGGCDSNAAILTTLSFRTKLFVSGRTLVCGSERYQLAAFGFAASSAASAAAGPGQR